MKFMEKYYTDSGDYQGTVILQFSIFKRFRFIWFTDLGEWFMFFRFNNKYIRFSSCGFDKNF